VFGPVRADDLPDFLDAGMKADPEMRRVRFPWQDRVALIPIELLAGLKYGLPVAVVLCLAAGFGAEGYSLARVATAGAVSLALLLGTVIAGAVLLPALLPWLPGRLFAVKGAVVGAICLVVIACLALVRPAVLPSWAAAGAWLCLVPAVTSHLATNFTGASTYTSLSGVLKEMRLALPWQIGLAVVGLGLWIAALFI
jgi:acetyl-CoA decarbonylase/synthase complex subunit gamma